MYEIGAVIFSFILWLGIIASALLALKALYHWERKEWCDRWLFEEAKKQAEQTKP